jgi:2-polyprenyl-3-methyl-5-hydroxy-6-metoxy-1,4-benzoquinol methylase
VADPHPHARFSELRFDDFQRMAQDQALTANERSGFPESYRSGAERAILQDIVAKLPVLAGRGASVVDIGCGATPLTAAIRALCHEHSHELLLVDGPDVLAQLPDAPGVTKLSGRFPQIPALQQEWNGRCDAIIVYSVMQFVFIEASAFAFVDALLTMLRPGGRALIADLPNQSMRRRFLASDAGRVFHREYMQTDAPPDLSWPASPRPELDDGAVVGLLLRARGAGLHAWLVPQASDLPMANRREDLLLERP